MNSETWTIRLLGELSAERGGEILDRFRTQKTAALLAYLAYFRTRAHSREELAELLWPETDPQAARNSLKVALSALRQQLEPPGTQRGSVLCADRVLVRLVPGAVRTDVERFEAAAAASRAAPGCAERLLRLREAVAEYSGPLLPGVYDDWAGVEQQRLSDLALSLYRDLIAALSEEGELREALSYARRALALDPLRVESLRELIRLYGALGEPTAAVAQYRELEARLREERGLAPSAATRDLIR